MTNQVVPSRHTLQAALHVATILGERAVSRDDARESYWHRATGGTFSPEDLERGEELLVRTGLVSISKGDLRAGRQLRSILSGSVDDALAHLLRELLSASPDHLTVPDAELRNIVPDEARRRELLLTLARRFDDHRAKQIGDAGEQYVVEFCRNELRRLGRPDLSRQVRQLSLTSDQLGYDVLAPRLEGPPRLIEVKASTVRDPFSFTCSLSRSEYEVGQRLIDWALVLCWIDEDGEGEICGWMAPSALIALVPHDSTVARWTQAHLEIDLRVVLPGVPRCVV